MLDLGVTSRDFHSVRTIRGIKAVLLFPVVRHSIVVTICGRGQGAIIWPAILKWQVEFRVDDGATTLPNATDNPYVYHVPRGKRGAYIRQHRFISVSRRLHCR